MAREIELFNKKLSKKHSIKLDVSKISSYKVNKFRYKKVKDIMHELGTLLDFDSSYEQKITCNILSLNSTPTRIDCEIRFHHFGVFNFSILFFKDQVKIKNESNNKDNNYCSFEEFRNMYYSFEYSCYKNRINDFEDIFCSEEEYIASDRSLYIPLIQAYLI